MILDLSTYPTLSERVHAVRANVRELLEYMRAAGKAPAVLHLYANDYNAVVRTVNAAQKRAARAAARTEEQKLRAQGKKGDAAKVKPAPDLVESVQWGGVPVEPRTYSRPRRVEA